LDGIHPGLFGKRVDTPYCNYLRSRGYEGENPWHDYANSAEGPNGEILSGWKMRHAARPARIREEDSETPYMIDRAMTDRRAEASGDQEAHPAHAVLQEFSL